MPLNAAGQIGLLRVHDLGTGYGPPSDAVDVEVIMQFVGRPADAFGFQLRNDSKGPARRGMLDLLRDAFNHGWIAHIDFEIPAGHHNGVIVRTWVTKPVIIGPVIGPPIVVRAKRASSRRAGGAARRRRRS